MEVGWSFWASREVWPTGRTIIQHRTLAVHYLESLETFSITFRGADRLSLHSTIHHSPWKGTIELERR